MAKRKSSFHGIRSVFLKDELLSHVERTFMIFEQLSKKMEATIKNYKQDVLRKVKWEPGFYSPEPIYRYLDKTNQKKYITKIVWKSMKYRGDKGKNPLGVYKKQLDDINWMIERNSEAKRMQKVIKQYKREIDKLNRTSLKLTEMMNEIKRTVYWLSYHDLDDLDLDLFMESMPPLKKQKSTDEGKQRKGDTPLKDVSYDVIEKVNDDEISIDFDPDLMDLNSED